MNPKPIELHLHTVDSLLKELISGRPVLIKQDEEFEISSPKSRVILNWYKDNQNRWSRNAKEDVKILAKILSQTPPSFAPQAPKAKKSISHLHLKKIEINQFGGVNKFTSSTTKNFEFEPQKSVTLFQGHNGAGKTSLVSAICWCLCGYVYRSQNPPQNPNTVMDLKIKVNGRPDIIKKASIITPVPPSDYAQSLREDNIPLNTWVRLSFSDDNGNIVGHIKRSINWRSSRGANIEETVDGLDVLGIDPICLEIGSKIPGLIPYIQLDSASDLGKAIAELTGLRAISDLVKHATTSKDKLNKDLPKEANGEIDRINKEYDLKRVELNDHFKLYPDITPNEEIPQASDSGLLNKINKQVDTFEGLLNKSLIKTKEILGKDFDPNNQKIRDDLTKNISLALDAIENQNIMELASAKKLSMLKNMDPEILNIEAKIQQILDEANNISELAKKPELEKREQLYARISGWIEKAKHDRNICPICLESLINKNDPVTKKCICGHIQEHLDNPKQFLRFTIKEWGAKYIDEINSKYKNIPQIGQLPASPQELIKQIIVEEIFAKPCFQLSMAPLKETTRLLVERAMQTLPVYNEPEPCKISEFISESCPNLLLFLHNLQQIVQFSKWRRGAGDECKKMFEMILGKKDKLPDLLADYNLRQCLETLQSIVSNALPIKMALEKMKELRDKISINRNEQEQLMAQYREAAIAIDDIINLGDIVDKQIQLLMEKLSVKAKEWKEKLYHAAYKGHPELAGSEISANGALQIEAEIQGTRTAAQHVSNSSDLRSTLLAVYFALWEYLYENRGGISLIILDDLNELFDQRNFRKYSKSLPNIVQNGANLILTTNNRQFSDFVNKAFKGENIQRRQVHSLSENRENIGIALFEEDVEKKKKAYEENKNNDSAAKDYIEELRIYLEQQLGDILCDIRLANPLPTMSDYIDKIKNMHNNSVPPFNQHVFEALMTQTALRSNETDFMELINKSHHGSSSGIAYNDITDSIKNEIKIIMRLINEAHTAYELWLMREKAPEQKQPPCRPMCNDQLSFDIPLYRNIAASSYNESSQGDISFEKINQALLGEYAIYQLRANNFGFSANIGYKAIVKLSDEPIRPNSLVIALHNNKIYCRRYPKTFDGNMVVLNSEMLDFERRPPSLVLPIEEVRLLEVVGFLFDEKDYSNNSKEEAVLIENYKLADKIAMAFKVRGDSAIPLALDGQVILGGPQIIARDIDRNIGKMVALATSENEQIFKRIGTCVGSGRTSHIRVFDTIGGLGNSKVFRTEELEDDLFCHIPSIIPESVREVVGVLYVIP